jgi:hypothetical protein
MNLSGSQLLLAIGAIAVLLYIVKKGNERAIENMQGACGYSHASGSNWGIADCQGNQDVCKRNCKRMNGEWLKQGGSEGTGGCWCNGCVGLTWGGTTPKRSFTF